MKLQVPMASMTFAASKLASLAPSTTRFARPAEGAMCFSNIGCTDRNH